MQGLIIAIVAIWVGLDQALKFWTIANVPFGTVAEYQPFPAFMSLAHVRNTGAAWSLFSSATPFLVVVRLVVGAAILVWLLRKPRPKLESVAFSFIVAGAWGNAIDGLQYGYVVDMLQNHWLTAVYRIIQPNQIFPIFNLADTGVVGGVLLLVALSFLPKKLEPIVATEAQNSHLENAESHSHLENGEAQGLESESSQVKPELTVPTPLEPVKHES